MQCWKTFFYEKVEEKDKRRLLREGVETVKANLGEQFSKKKEKKSFGYCESIVPTQFLIKALDTILNYKNE